MENLRTNKLLSRITFVFLLTLIPGLIFAQYFFSLEILKGKYSNWGVSPFNTASSINLASAWKIFRHKKDVVVAVIDTGIDPKHTFLAPNIYVKKGTPGKKNFGVDFSNNSTTLTPWDRHGHGSHISGIIKTIHPKVNILSLKYFNPRASGKKNLDATIEAIKYAVKHEVDIINYSGGGPRPSQAERAALLQAQKKGILIVAAAGNEESNIDQKSQAYYPASYKLDNIITVTAHDQSLRILPSSNYGRQSVDIAAPGYRIRSSLPAARSGFLTGTSQATAFVTGIAALIKSQYPKLSSTSIKNLIMRSAKKEASLTNKCQTGGRADAWKAILLAAQYDQKRVPAQTSPQK